MSPNLTGQCVMMGRLQPQISALQTRIQTLESSSGDVGLGDLISRVDTLEAQISVPINPVKVVQTYEDESEIVYVKQNG